MKGGRVALMALALSLGCGQTHAQINGETRDSFTKSFKGACLERQKSNPVNQGVSDNLLREYCACNASFLADRVTPEELAASAAPAAQGHTPSWFVANARAASDYCSRDLTKYAGVVA